MLDAPFIWSLATTFPALFPGRALHHTALHAALAGKADVAEALFERAADRYRLDLEVEPLARLRIHQLVARARAIRDPSREAELLLEAAQRLARLQRIESFDPPFAMIPAGGLFETGLPRAALDRARVGGLRSAA